MKGKNNQKRITSKSGLTIIDIDGKTLFQGVLSEIPLRDEYIRAKSIELFNEAEPCIIYRTHIAKRFYLELYEMLTLKGEREILCSEMKSLFKDVDLDTEQAVIYFHN